MSLLDCAFYSDTYGAEYELALSAWGDGTLCESDLPDFQRPDGILKRFKDRYRRYPKDISLLVKDPRAVGYDYCFTGIDPSFLEKLETLKELILPDSVVSLETTPKLERILKVNNTLIRGGFGSFAERFAAGAGLRFRPADTVFAECDFAPVPESATLTLVFARSGDVCVREEITAPGTNAGNTLGGCFYHKLGRHFFIRATAEKIADGFGEKLRDAVIKDGRLAAFIEKAKERGYYTGKN